MLKSLQQLSDAVEIEKIKGSRFIAIAGPCEDIAKAQAIAADQWRAHPAARHCCWAYRGLNGDSGRWDDNGEPSGSAGRPILQVIEGLGLSQVGVWVIRYFGGTKLGVGGLARAYSAAAQAALAASELIILRERQRLTLTFAYPLEGKLKHLIETHEGVLEESLYTSEVCLKVNFLRDEAEAFALAAIEHCAGRIKLDRSPIYLG